MTPEVKIIHQLSQNKIFEISSKSEGDLKAWVANGQYLMENPLVPNSQKEPMNSSYDFKIPTVSILL